MRTTMKKMILASLLLSTALLAAGSAYAAPLYFPHVATNFPWQTEIAIINTSTNQITGTLRGLSDEGQLIETKAVTLSARGRRQISVADEFTNHADIGYIIFDTNSDAVQGYTKFYIDKTYRAATPAVKEVNTSDIYISHIASSADWWTGVSLVNTTSATKELTITFNNGQIVSYTLNANQHRAFDIAQEFFNNHPQPDIQSAVITNASGVIGLELFGSKGWGTQLEGVLLTDKTTSTLYYPHVADNEWWTGIVAYNPSASSCTITITPYSAQGTPLSSSTLPIPGKGKYIGPVSQLGLPAQTAWFKITSTRPITGFELFGTIDGNQLAAYAGGGGTGAKSGVFAKIEKNGGWTGIAFVNTEASAASVTLTAYNDAGAVVASQPLTVDGHAKMVKPAEWIFSQDISSATYIAYSSDRNVVGFQLNGSSDWMMLDGLPGLGVDSTVTVQGNLTVASGDNATQYTVFNSNQSSTPSSAGSFSISATKDIPTYTYAISNTGKKVYAAVRTSADGSSMTINAQSTAEAMVLLCPLLIPRTSDERIKIINIVRADDAVKTLATVIESVYGSIDDPMSDSRISDALTNAVKSVLTSWQTSNKSVATALQQTIRKGSAFTYAVVRAASKGSSIQIYPTSSGVDMGALTLANSSGSTLKLELSNDVGPWGITTNIDWVVRIVELDPTKIQLTNSGVPILPTDINIDNLIKTGGYDEKTIIEGSVASGLLGVAFDPIGKISDSINAAVFPDAGINLPHDGVYAVIAFSGSPFGGDSGEEYNSVINSEWQKALWAEAAGINICAAAIDIVGVGTTFANAAGADIPDLSPVLEVELGLIKEELSKNPNYLGRASIATATGYFIGKAGDISNKLLDLLRPHIKSLSSLSNQEFSGWQILIHKSFEVVTSVVDVWSGTISASTRILNYLNSVTPRESGYAVLGTFSGQAPSTPTDFSVTAAASSQINLAWTAPTGTVSGYKVYKNGTYLKSVSTISTSDTGLSPSTNYCYSVTAYNSAGESTQSSSLCATTQAPPLSPPSTPTGFTVTPASSSQINLAWTASTGTVTGYKVYKSGGSLLKTVTTTSTSDTGLNASTNYCYYVIAYNSAGDSVQTSQLCATTQNLTSTYSIAGSVTLNGSGLSGVTITLTGTGSTSTITNSNGNYTFAGAQNGSYTVTPSMTGYTFTPANQAVTINGANATASNFIASSGSTIYKLVYVSGNNQTYVGGGMPYPMVFKIFNSIQGNYISSLYLSSLGLSLTSSADIGYEDVAFNNLNDDCHDGSNICYGGYYYLPSSHYYPYPTSPYVVVIKVELKLNGNTIDSYTVNQNILAN